MAITKEELMGILVAAFPDADPQTDIKLEDTIGDSDHYSLFITSGRFAGVGVLQQHKMVNDALKEVLKKRLHAISIETREK